MQKVVRMLALFGKLAGVIAGLGAYVDVIPPKYAPIGVIVFGVASLLKDFVNRIGDIIDDGKANNSFTA